MTSDTLDQLFRDHVIIMQSKGLFATAPKIIAASEACPVKTSQGKYRTPAGTIGHCGDVPYNRSTPLCVALKEPISAALIHQKTASIASAIKNYVPVDLFAVFLEDFLHSVTSQCEQNVWRSITRSVSEIQGMGISFVGKPEWKDLLLRSRWDAGLCPELALSLTLWRASYMPFLRKLNSAIQNNAQLKADEKENGDYVTTQSLEIYHNFTVFSTLMPLIFQVYRNQTFQEQAEYLAQPIDDLRINVAIPVGWEQFFRKEMTRRNYTAEDIQSSHEGNSDGAVQVCPAHAHLRQIQEAKLVEYIYQFVCRHRDLLQPQLAVFRNLAPASRSWRSDVLKEKASVQPY